MRPEEIDGHSVDGELDVAKGGLDDLPVIRGHEDQECREYFGVHLWRDRVYKRS